MTDHDINREGLGDALEAIAEQSSPAPVADALAEVNRIEREREHAVTYVLEAGERLAVVPF